MEKEKLSEIQEEDCDSVFGDPNVPPHHVNKEVLNTSVLLNSTFNTIKKQSEEMLISPKIPMVDNNNALPQKGTVCSCDCRKESDERFEARMMKKLTDNFNQILADYFGDSGCFKPQLKRLVENEVGDLLANTSILNNDVSASNTPMKESSNTTGTKCDKIAKSPTPVPGLVEKLEHRIGVLDDSLERVEANIQDVYQDVVQCRLDASSAFDLHHQRLGALRNVGM